MTYSQPLLSIIVCLGLFGFVRFRSRMGRTLCGAAAIGLVLISWPPLDWSFSRVLEGGYPLPGKPAEPAQAIVVFGSGFDQRRRGHPVNVPSRQSYERCEYAAWLYKEWRNVPVLTCGGDRRGESVAKLMADLIARAGVPKDAILMEERSTSTHENAAFAAEILRNAGIRTVALVVDSRSMPRAAACLRREGINVVPAPSTFTDPPLNAEDWLPDWKAIGRNEITLHEIVGLCWYKLRGWI
jgi:uncharacterized SAM-binding protein YcdF (DUF218 family)